MLQYYILTTVFMLLSMLLLLFVFEPKRTNYYFMLMMLIMTVANGGYLAIALSKTLEEAVLANKIAYLGGCFVPLLTLLLTCAICNYHMKAWMKVIAYFCSFMVYAMVLTIGYSDIYYEHIYLDTGNSVTVLGHTYGPGHNFFYVLLYGLIIYQVILLVYIRKKQKAVSRKSLRSLLWLSVVTVGLFVLGKIFVPTIEIIPLVYVIDSWILLHLYKRCAMYNIEDNIVAAFDNQSSYGYLMFDHNLNYLGCNSIAERLFFWIVRRCS